MSYNEIISNKLFVGDYETAKDLSTLEKLGVTHIVACGFNSGYFQHLCKFRYFCIDIIDAPSSNILQFLPRVVKFIDNTLQDDKNGVVYVHCVHGQSRSCTVCVAYLIHQAYQSSDFISNNYCGDNSLLHQCYNTIMKSRPQMAINPGFVQQLEIYRQMKMSQYYQMESENRSDKDIQKVYIQSRAHAYYRSFRLKSEFEYNGCVNKAKFCPFIIIQPGLKQGTNETYHCQKCHNPLFTNMNILHQWSQDDLSMLPISDYWKDSNGGLEYYNKYNNILNSNNNKSEERRKTKFQSVLAQEQDILKVEPMKWMKTLLCENSSYEGNILCPNCSTTLGYYDWINRVDLPTIVIILKCKVLRK